MFIGQSVAQTLPPGIANTFKIGPEPSGKAKLPANNSEALTLKAQFRLTVKYGSA